jgi:ABC-2 type transport system permease protein
MPSLEDVFLRLTRATWGPRQVVASEVADAKTLALISRELIAYFSSPLAYVVLFAFLLSTTAWFWVIVSFLNRPETQAMHPLRLLFGGTIFFWLLMLFLLPVIIDALLAEAPRSGTLSTVLLTSPVSETRW